MDLLLPALFVDLVRLDQSTATPLVVNRDPEPGETGVPVAEPVRFDLVDGGATGLDPASIEVRIGNRVVYSAGGFLPGFSGSVTWIEAWWARVAVEADDPFPSNSYVPVAVDVALVAGPPTTFSWSFQTEDATAPRLLSAEAIAENMIRVRFAEPVVPDEQSATTVEATLPWGMEPLAFDPVEEQWTGGVQGHAYVRGVVEPYVLASGDTLDVELDGADPVRLRFWWQSFANIAAATAAEVAAAIVAKLGADTAYALGGRIYVRSPSQQGASVEVAGGTAAAKLGLSGSSEMRLPFAPFPVVIGGNVEPFALADDMTLSVKLNGAAAVTVTFDVRDFADIGAATAEEMAAVLRRDLAGGHALAVGGAVRLYSLSPLAGTSVQVSGGSAQAVLGFPGSVSITTEEIETPQGAYPIQVYAAFQNGQESWRQVEQDLLRAAPTFVLVPTVDAMDVTSVGNPLCWRIARQNAPFVPAVGELETKPLPEYQMSGYLRVAAVEQVDGSTFDLRLTVPMTPGFTANYRVIALREPGYTISDASGNAVDVDHNVIEFAGFVPPVPVGRRFDLWSMVLAGHRLADQTREYERFVACMQEAFSLVLYGIDRFEPSLTDPTTAPDRYVRAMLADAANPFQEEAEEASEAGRKRLLMELPFLYGLKGTADGIVAAIRLLFGLDAVVVPAAVEGWTLGEALLEEGDDQYEVALLSTDERWWLYAFDIEVNLQPAGQSRRVLTDAERVAIRRVVDFMRPAREHFHALIELPEMVPGVSHLELGVSLLGAWAATLRSLPGPWALVDGDTLLFSTDQGNYTVMFHAADFVDIGAATAAEAAVAVLAQVSADEVGALAVDGVLALTAAGQQATMQVTGGTAAAKLGFVVGTLQPAELMEETFMLH